MSTPPTDAYSSSRRSATIQAARRFDDKPSIILIKGASIIVITLNGDHLPIGDFVQGRDPTQQALLELRRLDGGEDRIETIMRRDTTLQVQKSCPPLPLGCPKSGNGDEIIRAKSPRKLQ